MVGLGALGIVTRVTLEVQPFFEMRQRVFQGVELGHAVRALRRDLRRGRERERLSPLRRADRAGLGQASQRRGDLDDDGDLEELLGRPGGGESRCTRCWAATPSTAPSRSGAPGPWSERLPHFRSGFTPSSGEELQSEFFVARDDAIAAIEAVRGLAGAIVPLLLISELRTIAADTLWLSPHEGRDTLALHFTWRRRPAEVETVVAQIEAALAPFAARPHWGKVFTARGRGDRPAVPAHARLPRPARANGPRAVPSSTTGCAHGFSAPRRRQPRDIGTGGHRPNHRVALGFHKVVEEPGSERPRGRPGKDTARPTPRRSWHTGRSPTGGRSSVG